MLRHAEHQEQTAQIQWVRAREKAEMADRQLHELMAYADDYRGGALSAARVGELVNRKHFVERLNAAIEQQRQICRQARQVQEGCRQRWRKQQQNLEALQRLKAQRVQAVAQEKARLEQRALDEFALQSLGRHK